MKLLTKISILASGALITGASLFGGLAAAAGTATLYFSPSSGSVAQGATLTVNVYEDSGSDTVNAVQANFTYPSSLLTYAGTSNSSAFGVEAETSGSGGNVKLGRGAAVGTSVSGAQIVATVRFTAITSSGTATLSFSGGSAVARSTDSTAESLSTQSSNYTLSAPPASPPPSGGGGTTPKSSTTSSKTTTPSSTPAASAPAATPTSTPQKAVLTISSIQTLDLSRTSATISWKTSAPASSEVDYGLSTKYGLSVANTALSTSHTLGLDAKSLVADHTFHFVVKSVDASGEAVASSDMTFMTAPKAAAPAKKTSGVWEALGVIVLLGALGAGGLFAMQRMRGGQPLSFGGPSTTTPPAAPPTTTPAAAAPARPAEKIIKPTPPPDSKTPPKA